MNKYLLVYGQGGCWSGYDNCEIILAKNEEDAMNKGFIISNYEIKNKNCGVSYTVEEITDTIENCKLYRCRLKKCIDIRARSLFKNKIYYDYNKLESVKNEKV